MTTKEASTRTVILDERLTSRYPATLTADDGTELTLTPMVPSDWSYLEAFLNDIPQSDKQFLRDDISDPEIVERWCRELDYRHILPLLAWKGDQIVADATLHQEPSLWTAHIGKMRLLVHPDFRRQGIGRQMAEHVIEVARDLGLHKLVSECAAEQEELQMLTKRMGFEVVARLPEFIRDRQERFHDMLLAVYTLR